MKEITEQEQTQVEEFTRILKELMSQSFEGTDNFLGVSNDMLLAFSMSMTISARENLSEEDFAQNPEVLAFSGMQFGMRIAAEVIKHA